jgi:hypothetical protein
MTMLTNWRWLTVLCVMSGAPLAQAQSPAPVSLATVRSLQCSFTLMTSGTWEKGVPAADPAKANKLLLRFEEIDAQDGTANTDGESSGAIGTRHVIARLLGDNLHFLAMNSSGSLYVTTVFADRESRTSGKFKAAHTRHEYMEVRLTGFTSRPEQYFGYCETVK